MYKNKNTKNYESDNENLKFQTRKWHIISDQKNSQYGKGDENDSTIKFNTEVIKPYLIDFSDEYILVTGNIAFVGGGNNTKGCFKNCTPFTRWVTHLNDERVETAENLDLIMNLYNLVRFVIIIQILQDLYGNAKEMNKI